MNTIGCEFSGSLRGHVRIIGAIAAKDILDAIKNKTTVSVILGVAVLMLSSQAMPLIVKVSSVHRVVVYDAGESRLVPELKKNRQLRLIKASSQQEMEEILGEASGAMLGLALPADFDQALESDRPPELSGYFAHWVSRSDAIEEQAFFEAQLTELAGGPVRVNIEGNVVYPQPDSDGQPYMFSTVLVVAIITISAFLVPYLMIEEKETKTMDALLVSPASIGQVVIGKAIAGLVYGLAAAGVVIAFNQALVVHWGLVILAAFCGASFAVAIGLLLGSIFDNPQNMSLWVSLIFIVLLMPVFLAMTRLNLPGILRTIMPWIPSAALAQVFRISFSGSVPLDQVLSNLGIVVGSAMLLLVAVVRIVRRSDR
jgi:ABC-2 type transport system permease protein